MGLWWLFIVLVGLFELFTEFYIQKSLIFNFIYLYPSRLSEMGAATCYPVGLKQLDLSHNRIRAWPTVSRSESLESLESTLPSCYALAEVSRSAKFACQGRYTNCICHFFFWLRWSSYLLQWGMVSYLHWVFFFFLLWFQHLLVVECGCVRCV